MSRTKSMGTREDARPPARTVVIARQNGHQKFIVRKWTAKILERGEVAPADAVAGHLQFRIDPALHAEHERQRQAEFAAMRQHCLFEEARARTSGGKIERWRQGYHQVTRLDFVRPFGK